MPHEHKNHAELLNNSEGYLYREAYPVPKFKGVSPAVQAKYESCLAKMEKQNRSRKRKHLPTYNKFAVCYSSVIEPKRKKPVVKRGRRAKISRRR